LHGLAVAMQARQRDAELEQRLHLVGVELERPLERLQRLGVALVVEQRASEEQQRQQVVRVLLEHLGQAHEDRKSTRLNSSHVAISYAVFCLKKKKITSRRR